MTLYYWIENAITWKEKLPELQHAIFCPHGKYKSGVFFGISTFSSIHVVPFTFEYSKELFFKSITETSRIPWNEGPTFLACHKEYVMPTMLRALDCLRHKNKIEIGNQLSVGRYFKSAADCLASPRIEVPENYQLKHIDITDIPLIASSYPFTTVDNHELAFKYISQLIILNNGVGLFTEDNELASWALRTEWNDVGIVQTVDRYKRRGFGKIVVDALSVQLAKIGIEPECFIVNDNSISEKMFTSLGWTKYEDVCRIDVKPIC